MIPNPSEATGRTEELFRDLWAVGWIVGIGIKQPRSEYLGWRARCDLEVRMQAQKLFNRYAEMLNCLSSRFKDARLVKY
jgi:hypothetical protein